MDISYSYAIKLREFIYGISVIAVENGKTSAYSMVFCKVFSIILNNNEKQTLWDKDIGRFQCRRTYRVATRGQDAILSYWFNTDEGDGGLVGRFCGRGRLLARLVFFDAMLNSSNSRHVRFVSPYVIFHFGSTTHIPAYSKDIICPFLIPCERIIHVLRRLFRPAPPLKLWLSHTVSRPWNEACPTRPDTCSIYILYPSLCLCLHPSVILIPRLSSMTV